MKRKKVKFEGSQGYTLSAIIDMPDDENPKAFALFSHCFTCTKNLKSISNINEGLISLGIAVMRHDFTGLGESEGDFSETNFSSNVGDIYKAVEFLESEYEAPKIMIGHSLGGAATLKAAGDIDSCNAVATIAAPFQISHLTDKLTKRSKSTDDEGNAIVEIGGTEFKLKKQFFDDLEKHSLDDNIKNLGKPLLILHSPVDQTVHVDNAAKIFKAAKHPKSYISLDDADHLLWNESDAIYAGKIIGIWSEKYI